MASHETAHLYPTSLIHEFPKPTWIENLFVRSNGQLLVSHLTKPEFYLLDPGQPSHEPILLHSFSPSLSLLGIAEVAPDVFFVISGDYSLTKFASVPGSYSVWSVDLNSFKAGDPQASAKIDLVTAMPEAAFLNGMTKLPSSPHVLIADSTLGVVWSLNTENKKYEILIDVPEMKVPPPPGFPLSINGVKVHNGYLYFTNSGRALVCRVKIDQHGKRIGDVETLATGAFGDDLAIDDRGVWIAQGMMNTIGLLKQNTEDTWEVKAIAGAKDEILLAGGTACAFGRREGDEQTLYVVSNGGMSAPVNSQIVGGSVIKVDTKG